jgi:hypothetical protein
VTDNELGELRRFRQRESLVKDLVDFAKGMRPEDFRETMPAEFVHAFRQAARDLAGFEMEPHIDAKESCL